MSRPEKRDRLGKWYAVLETCEVKRTRSKIRRRPIGGLVCHLWNGHETRAGSAILIVPRPLGQAIWTWWWVLGLGDGGVWCAQLGARCWFQGPPGDSRALQGRFRQSGAFPLVDSMRCGDWRSQDRVRSVGSSDGPAPTLYPRIH